MQTRFRVSLAVFALAGALIIPAPATAEPDQKAAEAAWNRGETAKAIVLYEEVLALDPDNREALLRTAQVLGSKQKHAEALARYERVLLKNPEDVDAILGKTGALVSLGVNYEARPLLERLSREFPKRMEPRLNMAWMDLFSSKGVGKGVEDNDCALGLPSPGSEHRQRKQRDRSNPGGRSGDLRRNPV